jgi:hypothetical protein
MLPSKLVAKTSEKAPISATRKTNMVNQPRALEAIYPTCAIPDCEVIFDHCNVHHIDYWAISDSGERWLNRSQQHGPTLLKASPCRPRRQLETRTRSRNQGTRDHVDDESAGGVAVCQFLVLSFRA